MSKELADNYAGAFDGKLGFGRSPALVLVDLVEAYFAKDSPLYADADDCRQSAIRLRDAARAAGIPVIYTNVVYQADGSNGGVFFRKVPALQAFTKGNPMGGWARGLEPAENELVISKQYASAFFGTSLAATLTANSIDTVIIAGVSTSGCIRATCVDAIQHGFIPIVVREGCGDRHDAPHEASLFDMNAKYGDVVSETTVLDHLKALQ